MNAWNDNDSFSLLEAIVTWPSWCHRRVDKYVPMGSDRGRVQHSVDCTIPSDLPLNRFSPVSQPGLECDIQLQVLVPVAIVAKETLHEFDACDAAGNSLPVLNKRENSEISSRLLELLFDEVKRKSGGFTEESSAVLTQALQEITGDSTEARDTAVQLLQSGTYRGEKLIDPTLISKGSLLYALTMNLARGFILFVVLPRETMALRTVIKISYLWNFNNDLGRSATWRAILLGRRSLALPMTGASDTDSYHIEMQLPQSVICQGMRIPDPNNDVPGENRQGSGLTEIGKSTYPTVHLSANYRSQPPEGSAWLEIAGARTFLHWAALVGGLFGILLLWSLVISAEQLLTEKNYTSASTLLVTLPALVLGFVSIREDHTLGQHFAFAYRFVLISQIVLLVAAATVSLAVVDQDLIRLLWLIFALAGTSIWTLLILRQFSGTLVRLARILYYGMNQPELSLEKRWRILL